MNNLGEIITLPLNKQQGKGWISLIRTNLNPF